jgi:hypothetical protein
MGSSRDVPIDVFQEAAKAAQQRYGNAWFVLSPQEQARGIYEEMRRIDAEHAKQPARQRSRNRTDPSLAA